MVPPHPTLERRRVAPEPQKGCLFPRMLAAWCVWYHPRYHRPMAMTLRLSDAEADALRRRAQMESRSMQDVVKQALHEYVEAHSREDLLQSILDEEFPRYSEALDRLGR
jgi:hypothetical protein